MESVLKYFEAMFREKHINKNKQALTAKRDLLSDEIYTIASYLDNLKLEQRVVNEFLNKGEENGSTT